MYCMYLQSGGDCRLFQGPHHDGDSASGRVFFSLSELFFSCPLIPSWSAPKNPCAEEREKLAANHLKTGNQPNPVSF